MAVQVELAARARNQPAAELPADPVLGGCFLAYAPGEVGPGRAGDRAWAAAVAWQPEVGGAPRRMDGQLRRARGVPRRAADVLGQSVAAGRVGAAYLPGLLALREGPLLFGAASRLTPVPDLMLVDATGRDHPRRAGLALHLGAVLDMPTVGVTRKPLVAGGPEPEPVRGRRASLLLDGELVGYRVCTRTGARAVVAHAAWRTTPEQAAEIALAASTDAARTPVPLQEARRVAREARAAALG